MTSKNSMELKIKDGGHPLYQTEAPPSQVRSMVGQDTLGLSRKFIMQGADETESHEVRLLRPEPHGDNRLHSSMIRYYGKHSFSI